MNNHRTWLEISGSAFNHNIQQIKKLVGFVQFGLVVKANAYGHGMLHIAQLAEQHPAIDWLCVATLEEALALRALEIKKPILAMACTSNYYEQAIDAKIHCVAYDITQLADINKQARRLQKQAFIHLKIDTGMSRLGFNATQLQQLINRVALFKNIEFYGIFSHLCDTNNPDTTFTQQQIAYFEQCLALCKRHGLYFKLRHLFASGMLFKSSKYDMVRIGTAAYGFWKSPPQHQRFLATDPAFTLQPLLTWKAKLTHIAGSHGYISVGFCDGYPSYLVNNAYVYIHNKPYLVVEIAAHFSKILLTDTAYSLGDEVTLLGNLPGISATELATTINTINNEFTTRICPTIPRILVE